MSRISSCAACHGDIMIPGPAQPLDRMRCPLCGTEFLVQDVLAASILAPPEAIPVEAPLAGITAAVGPRLSRGAEAPEYATELPPDTRRPKKKQPSFFSHLIGVVGGGLLGLSIGYVALLKVFGLSYDFLEIADKLPEWATSPIPALQHRAGIGNQPPGNERGLKELLDAPDEPPTVNVPFPDAGAFPAGAPAPHASPAPPFEEPPPPAPFMPGAGEPKSEAPPPEQRPANPFGDAPPKGAAATQAPVPGPRNFTPYSAEDLTLAVNEVSSAMRCPVCNGTGSTTRTVVTSPREIKGAKVQQTSERHVACEACGGKPIAKMTPELYAKLSHLAEVVTFVARGDTNAWSQREAVQTLLVTVGTDQKAAEAVGRLSGFQLDQNQHKDTGIALAGTVQQLSQTGNLYTMRLVLFGLPKPVTVVSWRPAQPAIREHDRVLILGCIVDNPAENLAGYEGRLPQVVWGGLPVKLPPQP